MIFSGADGKDITMIRGDDESLTVSCRLKNGTAYPLVAGDSVYFTVKKSLRSIENEFQVVVTSFVEGKAHVEIPSALTEMVDFGEYVYDVEAVFANTKHKTIIPSHKFNVRG
jgi:hypothetical protein